MFKPDNKSATRAGISSWGCCALRTNTDFWSNKTGCIELRYVCSSSLWQRISAGQRARATKKSPGLAGTLWDQSLEKQSQFFTRQPASPVKPAPLRRWAGVCLVLKTSWPQCSLQGKSREWEGYICSALIASGWLSLSSMDFLHEI